MSNQKNSFIVYNEWQETFEALSEEDAGKLIKALILYSTTGKTEEMSPLLRLAFIPMRQQLNRDNDKYQRVCDRNRTNGSRGGRPKKNPDNPVGILGTQNNPEKPKKPDDDDDDDNDNKYIGEYIQKYNKLFGSHSQVTAGRKLKYQSRLKIFTHEQIMQALQNLSENKFAMGDNDRGWVADPDYLIRSDENVDKYLNQVKAKKGNIMDDLANKINEGRTL